MFAAKLQNFLVYFVEQDIIYLALLRGVYYTRIYPYLSYGDIVWGNTYTTRLEPTWRLEKKIIMIITFSKFRKYACRLFKKLLISPFDDINNEAIALLSLLLQQQSTIIFQWFLLSEQRCSSIQHKIIL